ncbi:MAG: PAS domain S-box protein [Desulfobacteraceae bacterium]|jgi:PAS domain S-box-containing protein|nr:PAS domain S-box protein [Desulfobacteraceae bacterium]
MPEKPTYAELEERVKKLSKDLHIRIQYEEISNQNEKQYRDLLSGIEDGYYEVDIAGNLFFFNDSLCKIYGYDRHELMGMNNQKYMTPETAQKAYSVFNRVYRTGEPTKTFDWEFIKKDGTKIDVAISVSIIKNSKGEAIGFRGIVRDIGERKRIEATLKKSHDELERRVEERTRDLIKINKRLEQEITERKFTEEALRESEARYRVITENMSDTIWMMDMNLKITYITPSVVHSLGYPLEELKALPLKKSFTPDSWQTFRHLVAEELSPEKLGKKDFKIERTLEFALCRKDGSSFWSEITMTLIRGNDGTPKGFVGVGRDITERKKAEVSLILSEEKFRKAVLTSPDAIIVTCLADGTFVLANQGFFELSGYTEKEVIGKTSFDISFWENPEDRKKIMEKLSVEDSVKNFESRFRKKNGDVAFGLMSGSIILLDSVPHVLTITKDITDRKLAEEENVRLDAQLQQSQKMEAIGTLAGGIAHDFNNILSAILGYTELALSDLPQGSNSRDDLDEVLKASNRAKELVNQILMFSRQSENQALLIQIHLIAKEALKLLRSSLPSSIIINQNIQALGNVLADPTQIHQIMMNLCTNASHAMAKNGGELSVSLIQVNIVDDKSEPINLPPGPYLKLTVSDTGCGIAPDVINRIFEPYFTTKGIDKGTGMGLSVVHGIVQSHGGLITVETTPGKGSSFHIYLPEVIDSDGHKETITAEEPVFTGTERILFVDDEPTNVKVSQKILERLGYEVVGRTSSVEALELFKTKPDQFDLVITDMTMPHMTGDQLARQLIKIRPDIPIILCTGFSNKKLEDEVKKIGIREFLMKPISRQVLSQTIRKVLDGPAGALELKPTVSALSP